MAENAILVLVKTLIGSTEALEAGGNRIPPKDGQANPNQESNQ
jgi:hypothetical protein